MKQTTRKPRTKSAKEKLISRLIAKAALDFKCCGHGKGSAK